ncbi:MAG: hypothetical protein J1F12_01570 [Muribaculaceae bacterium]|nr:hypothetical protein [Muribaculaceae bacterium]
MNAPYYILPYIEEYKSLDPESPEAQALSRKIAANIGDYASLRLILGIDPPEFAKFYPDMETASPSTFDTIDSFIQKFGKNDTGTGAYVIESEEIAAAPKEETQPTDLSNLIKQKKYKEALNFIEQQNLNNPKKSIYFAHQIRFLKKLIYIEAFRNKPKS